MTWNFVNDVSKEPNAFLFSVSAISSGIHLNESHGLTSYKTFMLNTFLSCAKRS